MAFNFNWSPLTADSDFYSKAKELLTTALNKSPKPPIIVDDILVNELNLGSTPPELEILEIGDLAEDRFRGIFKMCYTGDAFLTLKTRVQANPLNTYLSTKPSFTSPQPLAAASGLTIPIQITLSDIKLSAFIILVFSKQKGVTLVFRNDPLESLKVSSTFDSIPFVRDYLQKEIEGQVRVLLMDELPAIIHRLSLRLWVLEYRSQVDEELAEKTREEQKPIDPLAAPPQDAVDSFGNLVDPAEISYLSLDTNSSDATPLFSQKNLLRLAALTDSHRTLSLFTPSIRDAVFRAWAGSSDRGDVPGSNTPVTPALSRTHSTLGSTSTIYTFSDDPKSSLMPSRPPLVSYGSTTGLSLGANRHSRSYAGRKKKTRVVNLRKRTNMNSDAESVSGESTTSAASSSVPPSSIGMALPPQIPEERDDGVVTPPRSPNSKVRFRNRQDSIDLGSSPPKLRPLTPIHKTDSPRLRVTDMGTQTPPLPLDGPAAEPMVAASSSSTVSDPEKSQYHYRPRRPIHELYHLHSYSHEKGSLSASASSINLNLHYPPPLLQSIEAASSSAISGGGILEKAWMLKMAADIARRHDEKIRGGVPVGGFWAAGSTSDDGREETPPPAYEVS